MLTQIRLFSALLFSFVLTFILLSARFPFLPRDHGKAYAVNGELSKGKLRGVGILIAAAFCLAALLFMPMSAERTVYLVMIMITSLSGYLDDRSEKPWNEYLKGAIDLVIALVVSLCFIACCETRVTFLAWEFTLPVPVYLILGIILIWASINVTNCADGVDGLCASLVIVSSATFELAFKDSLGNMAGTGLIMSASLLAYLYFNSSPSSMLMGDAGSRPLGLILAILSMKSGHPFAFLAVAAVIIVDGGTGLIKVTLIRFFKLHVMTDLRTPIHDHMRKNLEWSDTQVVSRFVIIQVFISLLFLMINKSGIIF